MARPPGPAPTVGAGAPPDVVSGSALERERLVSHKTLRDWIEQGRLANYAEGGRGVRVSRAEVVSELAKRAASISATAAAKQLHVDSSRVVELCEAGDLPYRRFSGNSPYEIDRAAVEQLADRWKAERERFVTFREAERRTGEPWWVLREIVDEARIRVLEGAERPPGRGRGDNNASLVEWAPLEREVARLRAEPRRCPGCDELLALGRAWHRACRSQTFWESEEAENARANLRERQPELEAARCASYEKERAALDERKARERLLETTDVAEMLVVSPATVITYRAHGLEPYEQCLVGFALTNLYRHEDVERFRREWVRGLDGNHLRSNWFDDDTVIEIWKANGRLTRLAQRRGLSEEEAEAIVRHRVKRRQRLRRFRAGPKPGGGPSAHHIRWAGLFAELARELEDDHRRAVDLGLAVDGPPTRTAIAEAVAERDCAQHPDDWLPPERGVDGGLDPAYAGEAARRVLMALKRLQNPVTEITAA